ncbi:hypothetical protein FVEN_g6402 [Fusarium venenatum]|nr:hypothetical protein FVEN_g6402 [Fusarium venenatum]
MSAGHPNLSLGDPIHVYIDHSNLTIGGDTAYKSRGMGPWEHKVLALRHIIMKNLDFIETANSDSVNPDSTSQGTAGYDQNFGVFMEFWYWAGVFVFVLFDFRPLNGLDRRKVSR